MEVDASNKKHSGCTFFIFPSQSFVLPVNSESFLDFLNRAIEDWSVFAEAAPKELVNRGVQWELFEVPPFAEYEMAKLSARCDGDSSEILQSLVRFLGPKGVEVVPGDSPVKASGGSTGPRKLEDTKPYRNDES